MAHVLVVDDERAVREVLVDMLEQGGHSAIAAADGDEALRLFRRSRVDVVVTDLIMPLREGLETILELRRLDPDVRIVAISGGGQGSAGSYLDMARHLGAQYALSKPFSACELLEVVDGVLA